MNNTYTLELLKGADINSGFHCEDVFRIKKDAIPAFDIHFCWCDNDGHQWAKVVPLYKNGQAADLPGIYSHIQLMGLVDELLQNALNDMQGEFYAEVFYLENGAEIELPMDFLTNYKRGF